MSDYFKLLRVLWRVRNATNNLPFPVTFQDGYSKELGISEELYERWHGGGHNWIHGHYSPPKDSYPNVRFREVFPTEKGLTEIRLWTWVGRLLPVCILLISASSLFFGILNYLKPGNTMSEPKKELEYLSPEARQDILDCCSGATPEDMQVIYKAVFGGLLVECMEENTIVGNTKVWDENV